MQSGLLLLTTTVALATLVAGPQGALGGLTYTRWGRTTCPTTPGTTRVYGGFMAGSKWNEGGGSNYLCLPRQPQTLLPFSPAVNLLRATLLGVQYRFSDAPSSFYRNKNGRNAPCAVCHNANRDAALMIPARYSCPFLWTREYYGYLMATRKGHDNRYEFVCVDRRMQTFPGSASFASLYFTESTCNGLPCPNYSNGKELACVVCTK